MQTMGDIQAVRGFGSVHTLFNRCLEIFRELSGPDPTRLLSRAIEETHALWSSADEILWLHIGPRPQWLLNVTADEQRSGTVSGRPPVTAQMMADAVREIVKCCVRKNPALAPLLQQTARAIAEGKSMAAQSVSSPDERTKGGPRSSESEYVFAPDGDGYLLRGFDDRGHVRRLRGFDIIFRLIQSPGKAISIAELVKDSSSGTPVVLDGRSYQVTLDRDAVQSLNTRLQQLETELENAGNSPDAVDTQDEIESIKKQLGSTTGVAGKQRDLNNRIDKLRSGIYGNLKTAYKTLRQAKPPCINLADHFEQSISSESGEFLYRPAGLMVDWTTTAEK
jgi:hypothetical protein